MPLHHLPPARPTLHGHFSPHLAPALIIDPGDTVRFECLDAMWCTQRPEHWPWPRFEPKHSPQDDGHALTGPISIRGAEPGMMLEIAINAIIPGHWGWTWSWPAGERARALGVQGHTQHMQLWTVDSNSMTATDPRGRRVRIKPFMGVMGVTPPEPGIHSTTPPRIWGGNMDCKELVAGSTLYLPVGVPGALFSVGDGHALQGDGEVCGTAIEVPVRQLDLTFTLRTDLPTAAPLARLADPRAWLTFGFDPDLNTASLTALNHMLDLIMRLHDVPRNEALALASIAADLRITQIVNGAQGVHCILRDDAIAFSV